MGVILFNPSPLASSTPHFFIANSPFVPIHISGRWLRAIALLTPPILYLILNYCRGSLDFSSAGFAESLLFPPEHSNFLRTAGTVIFILCAGHYIFLLFKGESHRTPPEIDNLLLWLLASFNLATLSSNLLLTYLLLEAITFTSYPLIVFHSVRRSHSRFLLWYFMANGLSSALILLSFVLLYSSTGTLDLPTSAALLLCATGGTDLSLPVVSLWLTVFLFKFGLFPFHRWVLELCRFAAPQTLPIFLTFTKFAYLSIFGNLLVPFLHLPVPMAVLTFSFLGTMCISVLILYSPTLVLSEYFAALSLFSSATVVLPLLADPAGSAAGSYLYLLASSCSTSLLLLSALGYAPLRQLGLPLRFLPSIVHFRLVDLPWLFAHSLHTLALLGLPPLSPFLVKFIIFRSLAPDPFTFALLMPYALCSLLVLAFSFRTLSGILLELRGDVTLPRLGSSISRLQLILSVSLEFILLAFISFHLHI